MGLIDLLQHPLFLILLPIVAFLYPSVGHGGASGYIALMSIFAFPVTFSKPTALLLNILVSLIAFFIIIKEVIFVGNYFIRLQSPQFHLHFWAGILKLKIHYTKYFLGFF